MSKLGRRSSFRSSIYRRFRSSSRRSGRSDVTDPMDVEVTEVDRQTIRNAWIALRNSNNDKHMNDQMMIATAWLSASQHAPQRLWTIIGLGKDKETVSNALQHNKFAAIVKMVCNMFDTIIMRLDLQKVAICDYIAEVGARHAKYLGTQYTDPGFWDAFKTALNETIDTVTDTYHNKRIVDQSDKAKQMECWCKFIHLLVDCMRDGYVRELQRLDRVRGNLQIETTTFKKHPRQIRTRSSDSPMVRTYPQLSSIANLPTQATNDQSTENMSRDQEHDCNDKTTNTVERATSPIACDDSLYFTTLADPYPHLIKMRTNEQIPLDTPNMAELRAVKARHHFVKLESEESLCEFTSTQLCLNGKA